MTAVNESLEIFSGVALSLWKSQAGLPVASDQQKAVADWSGSDIATIARAISKCSAQANLAPLTSGDFVRLVGQAIETGAENALKPMGAHLAWMKEIRLPDFRENHLLTITPDALLEQSEGGEIQRGLPLVTKESAYVKTFSRQFLIGERLFEDDRSGLFIRLGATLALSAAVLIADVAFGVLTTNPNLADGAPFLSPAAGNQAAAPNVGPLSETTLAAALAGLRAQTVNGLRLNLAARYLLCGGNEELAARKWTREFFDTEELTVITDDRLTAKGFFLLADPAIMPAVARATLWQNPLEVSVQRASMAAALQVIARVDLGAAPISRQGIYWTPAA